MAHPCREICSQLSWMKPDGLGLLKCLAGAGLLKCGWFTPGKCIYHLLYWCRSFFTECFSCPLLVIFLLSLPQLLSQGKISQSKVAKLKAGYRLLQETLKWYVSLFVLWSNVWQHSWKGRTLEKYVQRHQTCVEVRIRPTGTSLKKSLAAYLM